MDMNKFLSQMKIAAMAFIITEFSGDCNYKRKNSPRQRFAGGFVLWQMDYFVLKSRPKVIGGAFSTVSTKRYFLWKRGMEAIIVSRR